MPKYRLTGSYYFPPDRGSPNGNKRRFSHTFQAKNNAAAVAHVVEWRKDRAIIQNPKLKRIVVEVKRHGFISFPQ